MKRFFTSRFGTSLGLALGRNVPPRLGYWFVGVGATLLARQKNASMVRAVRLNQQVVRGGNLSEKEVDDATRQVLAHTGRCFIDLYHSLGNAERTKNMVLETPEVRDLIKKTQKGERGGFLVAPHLSNFDLALQALALRGIQTWVLSYGQPTGGYELQNEIRAKTGLQIIPVSENTHQDAIEHMRKGGYIATAVDRPISSKAHTLTFFDRPSPLPAGHIRMALAADVPITILAPHMRPDGQYEIFVSEPIELQHFADEATTIRVNGETILKKFEGYIRMAPEQWLMFYPVWPDVKG